MSAELPRPEFEKQAVSFLESVGVPNPEVGQGGTINNPPRQPEIYDITTRRTTPLPQRLAADPPTPPFRRQFSAVQGNYIECDIFPCLITNVLGIDCSYEETDWTAPEILADSVPVRIPEATVYLEWVNTRIEGDVRLETNNDSEPGEKLITTIYPCEGREETRVNEIAESAVVDAQSTADFVIDRADEALDRVGVDMDDLRPQTTLSRDATFRKDGEWSVIRSLADYFFSGGMRVDVDIDIEARYEWRGQPLRETFSTTVDMFLPVDSVSWGW